MGLASYRYSACVPDSIAAVRAAHKACAAVRNNVRPTLIALLCVA